MIEKLTVGALQSKYWGSSLARGQEKLRRPGAKIATLLLVERRESSQRRVRKSEEKAVPNELSSLSTVAWIDPKRRWCVGISRIGQPNTKLGGRLSKIRNDWYYRRNMVICEKQMDQIKLNNLENTFIP